MSKSALGTFILVMSVACAFLCESRWQSATNALIFGVLAVANMATSDDRRKEVQP